MRARGTMMVVAMAAGLALGSPALAKDKTLADAPPPKAFTDMIQCRSIADAAQRLACFDASVTALAAAQQNKELYVADKETMRETRRGLFGFNLPKLRIFGDDDMDQDVDSIESTVSAVSQWQRGFVFVLKDGAKWRQTDGAYMDKPKIGATIRIRRAALGSYFGSIDKKAGFRIERVNQ